MLQHPGYTEDLMSLSTITKNDAPPKQVKYVKGNNFSLSTGDIDGARPTLKGYQYINKPDFTGTHGIEKSQPAVLHQAINRPEYNLLTHDIDGARPKKDEFSTTRIGHNPLNPVYKLPSYETRPITPPKFIRDAINITDIDGTKPEIYYKYATRNNMTTHDIDGARPKPEVQWNKPNFVDPKDINSDGIFRTTRSTNPLMPSYTIRDEEGRQIQYGDVEGSQPKQHIRAEQNAHKRHLTTEDIEGAKTGTVGMGPLGSRNRNQVRHPCSTEDILGATSGSLKKGINTIRTSNPLNPDYKLIGHTEEQAEQQKPIEIPKPEMDPVYAKANAKFWGTTPPPSVPSRAGSQKSESAGSRQGRNPEFTRNAARFFSGSVPSTPGLKEAEFKANADKFYQNAKAIPTTNSFQNIQNKGSIHRPKPKTSTIDPHNPAYAADIKNFYGAASSAGSQAASSRGSVDSEFRTNIMKFYGDSAQQNQPSESQLKRNAQRFFEAPQGGDYNFKLGRGDIGKPGKPPVNPAAREFKKASAKFYGATPPPSSGRASFVSAAEKFYT